MRQLLKLFLSLSSLLLLPGCSISKYSHLRCNADAASVNRIAPAALPIVKSGSVLKYKASIDILKNHLSGLIIVKQTDSITSHIVFVTELGMKMFDFESRNNEVRAVYVFEPLNKPKLIKSLVRNFDHMFLLSAQGKKGTLCNSNKGTRILKIKEAGNQWFYSSAPGQDSLGLNLQETFHKRRRTSKIEYEWNTQHNVCLQIKCKQYGLIKFYFELNAITQTDD